MITKKPKKEFRSALANHRSNHLLYLLCTIVTADVDDILELHDSWTFYSFDNVALIYVKPLDKKGYIHIVRTSMRRFIVTTSQGDYETFSTNHDTLQFVMQKAKEIHKDPLKRIKRKY